MVEWVRVRLNGTDPVPELRVELADLLPHVVADAVLDLVVVVPALHHLLVLPLAEPRPARQRDHRARRLV